jgi:hypothetical protein
VARQIALRRMDLGGLAMILKPPLVQLVVVLLVVDD